MSIQTHVDDGQILNRELLRVKTAQEGEATAIVNILGNGTEFGAQVGQQEVVLVNLSAVETPFYCRS